ncbi:MAG: hypothetical protein AB7F59_14045 [Bdellovibrionales bacterium]
MKYAMLVAVIALGLTTLFQNCAGKNEATSAAPELTGQQQIESIQGTWNFFSATCNGQVVIVKGYKNKMSINGSTYSDISESYTCKAMISNMTLIPSGNYVNHSGGTATCVPASCNLSYTFSISGQVTTSSTDCPSEMLTSSRPAKFSVAADILYQTFDYGNGTLCTFAYNKVP